MTPFFFGTDQTVRAALRNEAFSTQTSKARAPTQEVAVCG
jgi:hypothetical protein